MVLGAHLSLYWALIMPDKLPRHFWTNNKTRSCLPRGFLHQGGQGNTAKLKATEGFDPDTRICLSPAYNERPFLKNHSRDNFFSDYRRCLFHASITEYLKQIIWKKKVGGMVGRFISLGVQDWGIRIWQEPSPNVVEHITWQEEKRRAKFTCLCGTHQPMVASMRLWGQTPWDLSHPLPTLWPPSQHCFKFPTRDLGGAGCGHSKSKQLLRSGHHWFFLSTLCSFVERAWML